MKTLMKKVKGLWQDESAQGATEYILLLVVAIAIVVAFRDKIKTIISDKAGQVGEQIKGFDQ